jgi:intracellular sulfur oxidation DsrE/DsrF family protein
MIVTKEWMSKWFDYFNKLYFGNLPVPVLGLSRSKNRVGVMKSSFAHQPRIYAIDMSTRYDMTERQAQNILLHEMIHYFIAYNGLKDSSPHGTLFRKYMNGLNDKFGWEIGVNANHAGLKLVEEQSERNVYAVLTMKIKGQNYISSVSQKSIKRLDMQARKLLDLQEKSWYLSKSRFFINLPKVRTLKAMKIEESKLNELKSEMQLINNHVLRNN